MLGTTYAKLQTQAEQSVVPSVRLSCRGQWKKTLELRPWDAAVITEGSLECGEELREASHEGASMLGSDPWWLNVF